MRFFARGSWRGETVLDAPVTFADRTRQKVEAYHFTGTDDAWRCTVSAGVAAWPHPRIRSRRALLEAADQALYVAKALGRNRVVRFDSAVFNAHSPDVDDQHRTRSRRGRWV
ncbi:MAG TPA: GGDEF domain-containing protein [Gemmatimonadaceae bacterium]|nr:GGDEF domain-containing protein [Gemmatimonadaceae bacterium]